ncbi:winged helix-turn-helix domain-containing protein [Pelagicoccus sp. SDUM812003]|uniref:winged helix-turn-helix domain-containing protein n=1 Tax=Pelagicoccus sp. SDUM812003 TaxID=3041267 RepID=UPI0028106090|nr:winged helix-turn-helix domain-containing protein [Pelagicoccus sp. SDUM812003]MDQ8204293.1 winged helix-turn-helix domain-containing protein [Pelagicoccus sp. SDUM812003]
MIGHSHRKTLTPQESAAHSWTFFSNHAHVLVCLHYDEDLTLREVADQVGITERAVQKIVAELEAAGIISRSKLGRRNTYEVNASVRLRHPIEAHRSVGDLLDFVLKGR